MGWNNIITILSSVIIAGLMVTASVTYVVNNDDDNDDKGFDVKADSVNDAGDIMANEIADQIEAELRKIKPKYAIIFREMFNGNLQAINIAKNNNS